MPITLADATRIAPSDVLVDGSDPALEAWRKKTQIEGSSQFARGWETAGLSGQANSLYTQALKAERDGDEVGKQALLQQAQDLDTQAQAIYDALSGRRTEQAVLEARAVTRAAGLGLAAGTGTEDDDLEDDDAD